jgi:hypothetical protein
MLAFEKNMRFGRYVFLTVQFLCQATNLPILSAITLILNNILKKQHERKRLLKTGEKGRP